MPVRVSEHRDGDPEEHLQGSEHHNGHDTPQKEGEHGVEGGRGPPHHGKGSYVVKGEGGGGSEEEGEEVHEAKRGGGG